MLHGARGIFWREILILRRKFLKTLFASAVSPALFLLAFGFGVGRGASVGGHDYLSFLLPGLLTMASMNQSYAIATEINISRFYFKVFEEYLIAPFSRWQIVLGEMGYGIVRGLIPVAIIAIYSLLCGVNLHFGPGFFLALLLHLAIFSLLGVLAAMIVRSHADQATVNAFLITPMMFLSGTFFPVDQMPLPIKVVASLFPLTYTTRLIRATLLQNGDTSALLYLLLAAMVVILFWLTNRIIERVEA
ncbi:ABC transporter permease [Geopsychrobacter electrodiphilus]|uniref:ABC transporter permease n=1 Tax=Geopsychrobacter electrodiphilus TaxID=225196 RepID=UPI00036295E1|nr:ABC transporter permease [Geopsychrobacter electrodiphilus]